MRNLGLIILGGLFIMESVLSLGGCISHLPVPTLPPRLTATPTSTSAACTDGLGHTCTPSSTPTSSATSTPTTTPTVTFSSTKTSTATMTNSPTITRTATATFTVTQTTTVTSTPTNYLSAFVTFGSSTYFNRPYGIQYYNGNLWVVNEDGNNLQEWVTNGTSPTTIINSFNGGTAFDLPSFNSVDSAGNIYLADSGNSQVEVFNSSGQYLTNFGNSQLAPISSVASGVAVNSAGTTVYLAAYYAANPINLIYVYAGSGSNFTYQFSFGQTGNVTQVLHSPGQLSIDSSGNVWVNDNSSLKEFSATGTYLSAINTFIPVGDVQYFLFTSGVIFAPLGDNDVTVGNSSNAILGTFGENILATPEGIATDGAGNYYVVDSSNNRIVGFH